MEKINIYYLNINPALDFDEDVSIEKSIELNKVFEGYRKHIDSKAVINEVSMLSFYPKGEMNYSDFIEIYVKSYVKTQSILIFKSILDLSNFTSVAFSKLARLNNNENIKAIYFTDYSLEFEVKLYSAKLREIFKSSSSSASLEKEYKTRNPSIGPELTEVIVSLRTGSFYKDRQGLLTDDMIRKDMYGNRYIIPVSYKSIEDITRINQSTLRNINKHIYNPTSSRVKGRVATNLEKELLKDAMYEDNERIFEKFSYTIQTYYPDV